MNSISVVICAYTEARWNDLTRAINSLAIQTRPVDQIVVAIDHNEALATRVRQSFPHVCVTENSGPRGLSGARNAGVAAASGSIIAFLDDDAIANSDWVALLEQSFADPVVLGTGGTITPAWSAGRPGWFPNEFDWVVGCTYRGMPEQPTAVRNLIGCNMAFRREVFEQIGGFRIGRVGILSIGQENDETEFCIRLSAANPAALLLYQPAAGVQHCVPASRATLRYYMRRCFSEGMSKATLARQVGAQSGLSNERAYTLRTLPTGVLHGINETITQRDYNGLRRAGAIMLGLSTTVAGFLVGRLRMLRSSQSSIAKAHGEQAQAKERVSVSA